MINPQPMSYKDNHSFTFVVINVCSDEWLSTLLSVMVYIIIQKAVITTSYPGYLKLKHQRIRKIRSFPVLMPCKTSRTYRFCHQQSEQPINLYCQSLYIARNTSCQSLLNILKILTLCSGSDLSIELEKFEHINLLEQLIFRNLLNIDILVSLHFTIYHYVQPQ